MTDAPAGVALLVDADNAAPGNIEQVLSLLAPEGDVTVRRAYGNWFKSALKAWDAELTRRGFRLVQQSDPVKGKNATDLALAIDAVDLFHTIRPQVFALMSSDSDYASLALYLRERGAKVLGFGRPSTAQSFQAACTAFTLLPDSSSKPTEPVQHEPKREDTLSDLLTAAIAKNADKQGWARLSSVASHMRQQHGQTAKDLGKPTWTKVIKGLQGYELRNEGTTNVSVRVSPGS